jgi:hypothetical protein
MMQACLGDDGGGFCSIDNDTRGLRLHFECEELFYKHDTTPPVSCLNVNLVASCSLHREFVRMVIFLVAI